MRKEVTFVVLYRVTGKVSFRRWRVKEWISKACGFLWVKALQVERTVGVKVVGLCMVILQKKEVLTRQEEARGMWGVGRHMLEFDKPFLGLGLLL